MKEWLGLIDNKVFALKGRETDFFGKKIVPLEVVLFDDGETLMIFKEQCKYDHHDFNSSARIIKVAKNAKFWQKVNEEYQDADTAPS